jgi:hypothetical protein
VAPVANAVGGVLDELRGGSLPSLPVDLPDAPGTPGLPQEPPVGTAAPATPGSPGMPVPDGSVPSVPVEPVPGAPVVDDPARPVPHSIRLVLGTGVSGPVDLGFHAVSDAVPAAGGAVALAAAPASPAGSSGPLTDRVRDRAPAGALAGGSPSAAFGGGSSPAPASFVVLCAAVALAVAALWRRLAGFDRPLRPLAFVALLERPG